MGSRAKTTNGQNHARQVNYLRNGIVMLPTLKEEAEIKKKNNKKEV